jgi:hypothetical protein
MATLTFPIMQFLWWKKIDLVQKILSVALTYCELFFFQQQIAKQTFENVVNLLQGPY